MQHPLFDVIRPSDVIVLFAAAVSAAVPKMKFSHKAMVRVDVDEDKYDEQCTLKVLVKFLDERSPLI